MKSREREEIDKKLAESLPATDSPASTNGTGHKSRHDTKVPARRGTAEKIFHKLARILNGLHWIIGITTLPATATARDERSFVLMWLGIIVFMVLFFAAFIYFLGTT